MEEFQAGKMSNYDFKVKRVTGHSYFLQEREFSEK